MTAGFRLGQMMVWLVAGIRCIGGTMLVRFVFASQSHRSPTRQHMPGARCLGIGTIRPAT